MSLGISNTEAITMCDAAVDSVDTDTAQSNPVLRIYDGTPPTQVDDALSGNTLLAELDMSNPAFGGAVDASPGATATANAISDDTAANATGTATFFRIFDRQTVRKARLQGDVTATGGGGELELNSVNIQINARVEISSLTATMPES